MRFPELHRYPFVVVDFETTGLCWWKDRIFGVAVATPDGKSGYWELRDGDHVLRWLVDELPRCPEVVAHNAKFDSHFARESGIKLPEGRVTCTMVNAALIDEHLMAYDLDTLGLKYVGVGKDQTIWDELAKLFGGAPTKNYQMPNLMRAPPAMVAKYARQDATTTLKLHEWQQSEIARQDALDSEESPDRHGLASVVALEKRLLPVLVRMEQHGIRVNVERAHALLNETTTNIDRRYADIYKSCGDGFNINSPPQLRALFNPQKDDTGAWYTTDGTLCAQTDGGNPSLDSPTLRKMKDPRAALIVELRSLLKMRDTFLQNHIIDNARHHGGDVYTVHCNFNQARSENELGTVTGRLSANSPALHQIHKRDKDKAAIVRGLFLPRVDERWLCFDWDQFEFRWFAHYVNDPHINELYAADADTDFHAAVAKMTGLPRSPRFPGDANAKQINLGLVFGMGQGRLAAEMGLPHTVQRKNVGMDTRGRPVTKEYVVPGDEAVRVFETYHSNIPGVSALLGSASGIARGRGYVRTAMGRHIRFPRGMGVHKAGGLIFQGTSADSMKQKLVEIDDYIRSGTVKNDELLLMLSVHDETDMSCAASPRMLQYRDDVQRILQTFDGVECPIKCNIPIRASGGFGQNWWQACSDEAEKE